METPLAADKYRTLRNNIYKLFHSYDIFYCSVNKARLLRILWKVILQKYFPAEERASLYPCPMPCPSRPNPVQCPPPPPRTHTQNTIPGTVCFRWICSVIKRYTACQINRFVQSADLLIGISAMLFIREHAWATPIAKFRYLRCQISGNTISHQKTFWTKDDNMKLLIAYWETEVLQETCVLLPFWVCSNGSN